MSAAVPEYLIDAISAVADPPPEEEAPEASEDPTRRLVVAAHLDNARLHGALRGRREAIRRTGCDLPEPGIDLGRITGEVRAGRRRENARRVLILVTGALLVGPRPAEPLAWVAALASFFLVELAFRLERNARVRRYLATETPGRARTVGRGAEGPGGRGESVVTGTSRAPFPGSGREIAADTFAVDVGRPREEGRLPRILKVRDLERDTEIALRRLWLPRAEVHRRLYAGSPGAPARRYLVMEVPVGSAGGLLTVLVRYARRGDALLVEGRFRFLPPLSRDLPDAGSLHPRRTAGELARDVAMSLGRSPISWIGALGWIGSGVFRPAIAAARRRDGVQERSLRERLASDEPTGATEAEAAQLAMAVRQRLLHAIADWLVRRGVCPGPVRARVAGGDGTTAAERPVRPRKSRVRKGRTVAGAARRGRR